VSEQISVLMPERPGSLSRSAPGLVVEVSTASPPSFSAPAWRELPWARCDEITERIGSAPSTAKLSVDYAARRASETGPEHEPPLPEASETATGADIGFFLTELPAFALVRVSAESAEVRGNVAGRFHGEDFSAWPGAYNTARSRRVIFVGLVLPGWEWDLAGERMVYTASDLRALAARAVVRGKLYAHVPDGEESEEDFFLAAGLPDLDPEGRPEHLVVVESGVERRTYKFGPAGLNADLSGSALESGEAWCEHFSPGALLEYLRRVHSDAAGYGSTLGLVAVDSWLDWPEVTPGTHPGLFRAADPGDPEAGTLQLELRRLALGGGSLLEAIEKLVRLGAEAEPGATGALGFTFEAVDGEAARMRLVIFDAAAPPTALEDISLPEPGESVAEMPRREITGGVLAASFEEYRSSLVALGQRKVVQTTLSTVDGTLEKGWSDEEMTSWLYARASGTPDEHDDKLFPAVGLEFVIPKNIDWENSYFSAGVLPKTGGMVGVGDGEFLPRSPLHLLQDLVSSDRERAGRTGERVRLRILLWRSKDSGTTWERLPEGIQATLAPERPAVRLSPLARAEGALRESGIELPWAFAIATGPPYDVMLTVALEADDRLSHAFDSPAGEFAMEGFLDGTGRFARESVTKSRTLERTSGGLLAEVGKDAAFPLTERDDTERLEAAARRELARLSRAEVAGTVVLAGFVRRFCAGGQVRLVRTSAGARGSRTPGEAGYSIRALVREVRRRYAEQWTTTLVREGVGP